MKKKNGYTIAELLVVIGVVGVIALIAMVRISFAFEEINNKEEIEQRNHHLVEQASVSYAKSKKEDFAKEEETYIYAKEVAPAGFLFEKEEYNVMKVKIVYDENNDKFHAEIVK